MPHMAKKTTTIHLAIEPKFKAQLSEVARDLGLPLSFIVRQAIQQYLKSKEAAAA